MLDVLADLVAIPAPPGQEGALRSYLEGKLTEQGLPWRVDAKGNLLCGAENPSIVVTAHLDELALLVTGVDGDGFLHVSPLGGVFPWKWGEGPVEVLPLVGDALVPGVLSFGSIHTTHPAATIQSVREGHAPTWADARVRVAEGASVLPGQRVVMARERRRLWPVGDTIGSYFLDDRADLAAWLKVLEQFSPFSSEAGVLFAATTSEEIGGHGAQWLLGNTRPEVCIALELGPIAPDNTVALTATPTCWVTDGYAPTDPRDLALVQAAAQEAGTGVQFQALSRGGSDASCAASHGLCARPITLGFPCDNSHGFEIMHKEAIPQLAALTLAVLKGLQDSLASMSNG